MTGPAAGTSVSIVIPTFNRGRALEDHLPLLLAMEGVAELVVVVDGSTDDTVAVLNSIDDARLQVVVQPQAGAPAARNVGVARSTGDWLLVIDDDDLFPEDFARRLLAVAGREQADIVGAPWVDVGADGLEETLRRVKSNPVRTRDLATHPRTFPVGTIETPFLSNTALVHRRVFETVTYQASYRGNAWREETSFFISAVEAGFKVVLTDETYAYHLSKYEGGHRRPGLAYEYWLMRNNWRFLRRHRRWLRQHAGIDSIALAQLRFAYGRAADIVRGRLPRTSRP